MPLDVTPLRNAVQRLRAGLSRHRAEPSDEQLRDGLIQRFEFRAGNAAGLLKTDWPSWRRFREMRARTSHTYDNAVAAQVVAAIPDFLAEIEHFCAELERRLSP